MGHDGGAAEFIAVPAKALHKLPEAVDYEVAALIEPATVCFFAMEKISPISARSVAILGSGPIGLIALALAKAMGASLVMAVELLPERVAFARKLGADHAIDAKVMDASETIKDLTRGTGVDIVIEATGDPTSIQKAIEIVKPGGKIVLISLYEGMQSTILGDQLVTKDIELHGSMASAHVWGRVINFIAAGRLNLKPLITHTFSLDEAPHAFEVAERKSEGVIKVCLKPHAYGSPAFKAPMMDKLLGA